MAFFLVWRSLLLGFGCFVPRLELELELGECVERAWFYAPAERREGRRKAGASSPSLTWKGSAARGFAGFLARFRWGCGCRVLGLVAVGVVWLDGRRLAGVGVGVGVGVGSGRHTRWPCPGAGGCVRPLVQIHW
jgi:hypothetical protein